MLVDPTIKALKAKDTYVNKQVNLELQTQNGKKMDDNKKQIEEIQKLQKIERIKNFKERRK